MPHPSARRLSNPREQFVPAGDELFEHAGCSVEQLLDENRLVALDECEPRLARLRWHDMGEAHAPNLVGGVRGRAGRGAYDG
ncbi:hypothetical protein D3C87_2056540 [compost metagenome]